MAGFGVALLALAGCGGTPASSALSGRACLSKLTAEAVSYRPVDSPDASDSRCRIDTPVQVSRVEAALSRPATMSCAMASRLDSFEREVMQPLAKEELGRRVTRIDHLGSFSCRANSSRPSRLSQHALGQAIDILARLIGAKVQAQWGQLGQWRREGRFLAPPGQQGLSPLLGGADAGQQLGPLQPSAFRYRTGAVLRHLSVLAEA